MWWCWCSVNTPLIIEQSYLVIWGIQAQFQAQEKRLEKMSESCLKLSMSKGFHNWTTHEKVKDSNFFFLNNTNFWILEVWLWKVTLLCSKQQVWLVLRFSYHILLISLCPAHQFSRKLLPMSICNLVSTKCCYHQFMEGLWQKKKLSCLQASASFSKSCNKEFCHKQTSFSAQIKHAIWMFVIFFFSKTFVSSCQKAEERIWLFVK